MNMLDITTSTPTLFDLTTETGYASFAQFQKDHTDVYYIDTLGEQVHELNLVRDPRKISHGALDPNVKAEVTERQGVWAYFPWKHTAVRILAQTDYEELRLSRNKNLITGEEQNAVRRATIAVAGLNVGNPGAVCLALEGVGAQFKLADFDPLSVSNLNRFRAGLTDLNINKAIISARQMMEINPYLAIEIYEKGLDAGNTEAFLISPKIDILIEEIDNLKIKLTLREYAKTHKIPVLMVTGNGEHVIIDVERYDVESDVKLLNGFIADDVVSGIKNIVPGQGTYEDRIRLARDFMGAPYLDPRLVASFEEVGKTIAGIPQLAESSFLRGAALCHFTKHILLKHAIPSGRYAISLTGEAVKLI